MLFILNGAIIAQASNPFLNDLGNYLFPAPPVDSMPKALDQLWKITMNGNIYRFTCSIGLLLAVMAVGFWCVKFYKTLQEGTLQPAINEMIFPLILVILLSNNGANMRDLTMTARDMLNGVNRSVAVVTAAEADMQTAINVVTGSGAIRQVINSMFNTCNATNQISDFERCMATKAFAAKAFVRNRTDKWQSNNPNSNQNADFKLRVTDYVSDLIGFVDTQSNIRKEIQAEGAKQNAAAAAAPVAADGKTPNGNKQVGLFDIKSEDDAAVFNQSIASFRKAFLYIVEVMMLVTGLVGPIFLGLSLFPVTNKPFLPWGISFLSFCKICYTLISGLSAIAMVFNGPGTDMLVASMVLGLLAPVLAFSIASGSGLAALSQVSYSAQNFGMNNGIAISPIAGLPPAIVAQAQQVEEKPRATDSKSG
jgi:hypothetical protein